MKDLSVYYCPKCGRYGYYQLVRNTVCPSCDIKMVQLSMDYQQFTNLELEERDALIISKLLSRHESVTGHPIAADQSHNYRGTIASLSDRVQELETDNQQLNNTVEWMHQTIWDLLGKNKAMESQLSDLTPKQKKSD